MTLATFSKSWHCMPSFAEVARADVGTTNKQTLLDVFGVGGAFVGGAPTPFGGSPAVWYDCATGAVSTPSAFPTVRQTCDSSNVSAIGQNILDTTSKFVFANAPTARTWAVYELAELECEILLACQGASANASVVTMMVAPYGVTGSRFGSVVAGSTTVLPTATNAFTVISGAQWGGSGNVNAGFKWHLWRSTDGLAYRLVTCNGGEPSGALFYGASNRRACSVVQACYGVLVGCEREHKCLNVGKHEQHHSRERVRKRRLLDGCVVSLCAFVLHDCGDQGQRCEQ